MGILAHGADAQAQTGLLQQQPHEEDAEEGQVGQQALAGEDAAQDGDVLDKGDVNVGDLIGAEGAAGGGLLSRQNIHEEDSAACGRQVEGDTGQVQVCLTGDADEGDEQAGEQAYQHAAQQAQPHIAQVVGDGDGAQGGAEHHTFNTHIEHTCLPADKGGHSGEDQGRSHTDGIG